MFKKLKRAAVSMFAATDIWITILLSAVSMDREMFRVTRNKAKDMVISKI
jgi:hypothetical protein